ncbi:hypothetical protein BH10BAC6_BH10BAC6_06640 [soil metagenome]
MIRFYCSVLLHTFCAVACYGQCVPSVDSNGFCLTCDSASYRCDTILPLYNGGFIIRIQEKWFHANGANLTILLSSSETRFAYYNQFSHYLNLRVGSEDKWFDVANHYEVVPFSKMSVPDVPTCMYGLIGSKWSVIAPSGSIRTVKCDSLVDATWTCAIVQNNERRSLMRLDDSVMLLNDLGEGQFVGDGAVMYRFKTDTSRDYWRLYQMPSGINSTLRYDTIRVFDRYMVGRLADHDVLLDSRGVVLFETKPQEYIRECNRNRLEIYRNGGREAYMSDLGGRQLNQIALQSVWLGSTVYHIGFSTGDQSICVLNDDGVMVVPFKLYYSIRIIRGRVLFGINAGGILLAENASGSLVYLQITPNGYRELHCGQP